MGVYIQLLFVNIRIWSTHKNRALLRPSVAVFGKLYLEMSQDSYGPKLSPGPRLRCSKLCELGSRHRVKKFQDQD